MFGDVMADFQRADFEAMDHAFIALATGTAPTPPRFWWERTKGASKDSDLAAMIVWLLAVSQRALQCQVGAGDADQADELRKAAKAILRLNPWLDEIVKCHNWTLSNPATDSRCDILAADVSGAHGARPDLLIINELSHITKQEFAENLMDNAAKIPHGLVVIATNAGFLDSWQWNWRETARTSPRWKFSAYQQPAPWLDPEEIEEARKRNAPNRFARLWYGQWVPDSGDALDPADVKAALRAEGPMRGDEDGWGFAAGLDIGLAKDASALVIIGRHESGRFRLAEVRLWRPGPGRRVELSAIEEAVIELHARFGFGVVGFDPYQAEHLAERLDRAGVRMERVTFGGPNLTAMCTAVLDTFTAGNIDLYDHPQLMLDLAKLRVVEKSYGVRLESPRGPAGHGDCATALAIALLVGKDVTPSYFGTDAVISFGRDPLSAFPNLSSSGSALPHFGYSGPSNNWNK